MPVIECSNNSCRQTIRVEGEWSPTYAICNVCGTQHFVPYRIKSDDYEDKGKAPIPNIKPDNDDDRNKNPAPPTMDYYLQIFRDKAPSQTANLREGKNIIGRRNCDVVILDTTISRRHCVIEIRKDSRSNWQCLLYDIGYLEGTESTNGVFVDGRSQRLNNREQHIFQIGDRSQIGKTMIQLDSKSK
jgi:pSer/pThr/pTyr-binding forkhead associated (FHA) protein